MNLLKKILLALAILLAPVSLAQAQQFNPSVIPNYPTISGFLSAFPAGVANVPPFVVLTGSASISDGRGGEYWYNASDTTSSPGPTIIVDNAGRRWYLFQQQASGSSGTVTPYSYGAFCDGGSHLITSQDITNNPQWKFYYPVGTSWDTVGNQEAIGAAFAGGANATFTATGSGTNLTVSSVTGTIHVGDQVIGASGIPSETTISSQSSGTPGGAGVYITNNVTTATGAALHTVVWNAVAGTFPQLNKIFSLPYGQCQINKQILAIMRGFEFDFGQRLSTSWAWGGDPTVSMFQNDSALYGVFNNITLSGTAPIGGVTAASLWTIDHTGSFASGAPQQLTINNAVIETPVLGNGISIAPSGGGAQGDTIQFNNLVIPGFASNCGVSIGGANALSIIFNGGNIQGTNVGGICNRVGSAYVYGMSFQNQAPLGGFNWSPIYNQVTNGGADVLIAGSCGASCNNVVNDVRSESDVLVQAVAPVVVNNSNEVAADISAWFANFPFHPGALVTGGTKGHTFMLVSDGGNGHWNDTPTQGTTCTFTDNSQTWTVNQWAGYAFFFIYTNHFDEHHLIASNTAHTITLNGGDCLNATPVSGQNLYHIGGYSGGSAPSFDSAARSYATGPSPGTGQGFTTDENTGIVTVGSRINSAVSAGDFVVVPNAGPLLGQVAYTRYPTPLIASINSVSGAGPYTLHLTSGPAFSLTDGIGYTGSPIVDGNVEWIDISYSGIAGATDITNSYLQQGQVFTNTLGTSTRNVNAGRLDWFNPGFFLYPNNYYTLNNSSQVNGRTAALTAGSTVDLSAAVVANNAATLTPTADTALTLTTTYVAGTQPFTLILTSDGGSETVTCSTNLKCTGTLAMGAVAGKKFVLTFLNAAGTLLETARTAAE